MLLSAARTLASWQFWPPFRKLEPAKWKIIPLFTLKYTGHIFFFDDKLIFGSLGLPIDLGSHRSLVKAKASVQQCRSQAGVLPEDGHHSTAPSTLTHLPDPPLPLPPQKDSCQGARSIAE